ncbi:MAG: hypothetical protein KKD92_14055 [Proteobacteria bacterium]|nr:hypothetical protein [Pseudomonadota bacterium]
MENSEEKQNDVILSGVKEIEKQLHRSFINLVTLKTAYGFPLKKINGLPSVNLRELAEWVKEWGNGRPFEKITTEILQARQNHLKLLAMPATPLGSINEIVEFTGCEQHVIINWHKLGTNCPIKRDKTGYSVDGKDLRLWMEGMGIIAGYREIRSLDTF